MSTDLRIMGLDLSLNHTGLCSPAGSTEVLPPTGLRSTARHAAVRKDVLERARCADIVVLEAPFTTGMRGRSATDIDLIMLHGVINMALWSNRIAVAHIHPATLKVFATGKGNADKAAMRDALNGRLFLPPTDDNEVDAFWLRAAGLHHYGAPLFRGLSDVQVDALDKAVWPRVEDIVATAL